jgi:hypothetical protein
LVAALVAASAVVVPVMTPVASARADAREPIAISFRLQADLGGGAVTDRLRSWDCLTVANGGADDVPSGWAWGSGAAGQEHCGWPTTADQSANGQSVWLAHPIYTGLEPRDMYVLENKLTGKCLVSDMNGDTTRPDLVRFDGTGPFCGATEDQILRDARAIWDLYSTGGSTGPIRSIKTDRCLIFGNRGGDVYTSMYSWNSADGTKENCGLTMEDLHRTGQATFALDVLN